MLWVLKGCGYAMDIQGVCLYYGYLTGGGYVNGHYYIF